MHTRPVQNSDCSFIDKKNTLCPSLEVKEKSFETPHFTPLKKVWTTLYPIENKY